MLLKKTIPFHQYQQDDRLLPQAIDCEKHRDIWDLKSMQVLT
jgi:hypothetical protein